MYVGFINPNFLITRFPMMTPSQLADLLLNPLAKSHMELLVENIRVAMAHHKNKVWETGYICQCI